MTDKRSSPEAPEQPVATAVLAASFIRGSRRPPIVVVKPVENGTHDDPRSGAVVRRRRQRNTLLESLMRSGAIEIPNDPAAEEATTQHRGRSAAGAALRSSGPGKAAPPRSPSH